MVDRPRTVMRLPKEPRNWTGTYSMEDALYCLMIVPAIDAVKYL